MRQIGNGFTWGTFAGIGLIFWLYLMFGDPTKPINIVPILLALFFIIGRTFYIADEYLEKQ